MKKLFILTLAGLKRRCKKPEMKRKRVMKGKGWFESISRKIHKERDAECKRWQHEKKRKTRKRSQTGSGGAYALSKLFGRGKRKNPLKRKKRTGKKR